MHAVTKPPKDPMTEPGPWNAVAAGYDEVVFGQLPELCDAAIELLRPEKRDRVLDVAAGPGTLSVRLANLEARVMDGQELELDDCSFDGAISMFGVFLFDDRARGLSEMLRVVVPGGRVVSSSWLPPDVNTIIGAGMGALRQALPDLPRPTGPLPTQVADICVQELTDVGFDQVSARTFEKKVRYDSVELYWQSFERAAAPLTLLKKKLENATFASATERARATLTERFGTGPLELTCAAILTVGERPLSAA
jgi:ubiquinone/menaquinone biosynthesis C-methylase UbiE